MTNEQLIGTPARNLIYQQRERLKDTANRLLQNPTQSDQQKVKIAIASNQVNFLNQELERVQASGDQNETFKARYERELQLCLIALQTIQGYPGYRTLFSDIKPWEMDKLLMRLPDDFVRGEAYEWIKKTAKLINPDVSLDKPNDVVEVVKNDIKKQSEKVIPIQVQKDPLVEVKQHFYAIAQAMPSWGVTDIKSFEHVKQIYEKLPLPNRIEIEQLIIKAAQAKGLPLPFKRDSASGGFIFDIDAAENVFGFAKPIEQPPAAVKKPARKEHAFAQDQDVVKVKAEIFEKAGKRTKEELIQLQQSSRTAIENDKKEGLNKLKATVKETAVANQNLGDPIQDREITYIPGTNRSIHVVADLHGDSASLKQAINVAGFIENMVKGDKSDVIIFEGDYIHRGPKDDEVMEILLELKTRFPKNVVLLKADHEVDPVTDPDKLGIHLMQRFGMQDGQTLRQSYNDLFQQMPNMAVSEKGILAVHGGIPANYEQHTLTSLSGDPIALKQMRWADASKSIAPLFVQDGKTYVLAPPALANGIGLSKGRAEKHPRISEVPLLYEPSDEKKLAKYREILNQIITDTGALVFGPEATSSFLSKIMGEVDKGVIVRGHEKPEGSEIMFEGKLATIHSTGKGSNERADEYGSVSPSIVSFGPGVVDRINEDNIVRIWS